MSTYRRLTPAGQRYSRASSLDTATYSQPAVFSSSVESLSQSPILSAVQSVDHSLSPPDIDDVAAYQLSDLPLAGTQLHSKVFGLH